MKFLLTSAGLSNPTLVKSFEDTLGLSGDKVKIAFIPTAANIEEGDKEWLINDYANLNNQGYEIDIVDISAIEKEMWEARLKKANAIFFGGGNTFHLMHWISKSGLEEILPEILESRLYVGISAGSCVVAPTVYNSVQNLFGEKYNLKIEKGLGLFDFQFIPHLNSKFFSLIREENLKVASRDIKDTVYAMDDNSALKIINNNIEVVGTGKHLIFNKSTK